MRTWYGVLRKEEGDRWISLPGPTIWNLVELSAQLNIIYPFTVSLYPLLNTIQPGIYRVVKSIDIGELCPDWYMAAEFQIGNESSYSRDSKDTEPTSKPLSELGIEKIDTDIAYQVVEEMPEFPGGMSALPDFIQKNLQHDKADTKVRIIIQFIIDKEGNIVKPIILRNINSELDKEVLRIVSLMPKWKPGKQNGKAEKVRYTIPITFGPSIKKSDIKP